MGVSIYVCVMVAVGSVLGVGAARNGAGERSGEFREPEILKLWYVSMYVCKCMYELAVEPPRADSFVALLPTCSTVFVSTLTYYLLTLVRTS